MPMIDAILLFLHQYAPISLESTYAAVFKAESWLYATGLIGADIVLVLRTCAIWGNGRRIAIGLSSLLAAIAISEIYCVTRFTASLQFAKSDFSFISGFYITSEDPIIFVVYATLLGFETVVLLLTLWKINKQQGESMLYKILYRDSLIFYIYIFGVSVANIILLVASPVALRLILVEMHRILHAVFLGRIILNIRSAMARASTLHGENGGAFTSYILGETVATETDLNASEGAEGFTLD